MALSNKKLKAIDMLVYTDMQKQAIAEVLKVSPCTMSVWQKDPEFQEALKEEMNRGFKDMAIKARKKLNRLMDSDNEGISLAASREVLNRAGYSEVQKIEQTLKSDITIEIVP